MTVTPRGQSFQSAFSYKGKRYRRQFPTEIEAKRWELDSLDRLQKNLPVELGTQATTTEFRPATLQELADYMAEFHWQGTKGEKAAVINLKDMVKIIGPATKLDQISTHSINLAIRGLRERGLAVATINKKVSTVRTCLKYAEGQGWLAAKAPVLPFFEEANGRIRRFTADEEKAMHTAFGTTLDHEMQDFLTIGIDMGFRLSELLQIEVRDVGAVATVWDTKNNQPRSVPPTPRAKAALERRCKARGAGLLFPYSKEQVTRRWNTARDAIGMKDDPEFTMHVMRHTYCSRLADLDVSAQVIQKLAGHLRIETTLKYIHLSPTTLARAAERLASWVEPVYTATPELPHELPLANVA